MTSQGIVFALIREGTSDDALVPLLQDMLVRQGLAEVAGQGRNYPGSTMERLEAICAEDAAVDLVFVHRDADSRSSVERRQEIAEAVMSLPALTCPVVPVVPVQELEAWLLVDEAEIRRVAGRPRGGMDLGLPKLSAVEATHSPKEVLRSALALASPATGRRRDRQSARFGHQRRTLLERLDVDGPVRRLPAWRQLEEDIAVAAAQLLRG